MAVSRCIRAGHGRQAEAIRQVEFEWVYLFGAVCPASDKAHGCLLPYVDSESIIVYLADFSRNLPPEEHALMVLDTTFDSAGTGQLSSKKNIADLVPITEPAVRRLLLAVIWPRLRDIEKSLTWSFWRRRHQAIARRCHYRARDPAKTRL
ncbi:MAG: hypothetical protein HQ546_04205 [Planctomycetes bacterium]|nr:hypothetical protein [Planctomycetota bacterium]